MDKDSMEFTFTKVVSDKEITTRIFAQYIELKDVILLPDEKKDSILRTIIEVMKKLDSVKYHRDNLLKILDDEVKNKNKSENHTCMHIDLTTGAENELEAFIMQGKSCLDILTKILLPLIGNKVHTYGKSGDKVIGVLTNNLSDEEKERAKPLVKMIQDNKEWIEKWFSNKRDTITHYKAIDSTGFARKLKDDGQNSIQLPGTQEGGIPFHDIVISNYQNLLGFCEDFIALSASIKFYPGIILGILPENKKDKDFQTKFGTFLKNKQS